MTYQLRGNLSGLLCADCPEALSNVRVRLYRVFDRERETRRAVADPKETFAVLTEEQAEAKAQSLLAEAETDEQGNFTVELGASSGYDGGAFDVDVYCGTVPGRVPGPVPGRRSPRPIQISITTLQPRWRQSENGFAAAWEYRIPHRLWCAVRGYFGAWTICGTLTHCETKAPIANVRVSAFDRDWLQDDALGQAVTDGNGKFRIDYTPADFEETIFNVIHVELTSGPDLYFKVATLAGTPLLTEPPSRGRDADRENVGPCFCVDLCLREGVPPQSQPEPLPVFTSLGTYEYATEIHSAVPGSGLTVVGNRAFYSTVRLNGALPKKLDGVAMEYRFEVRTTDQTGGSPGAWSPVPLSAVARTEIGLLQRWAPDSPSDPNPVKTKVYTVNGTAGPTEVVAAVTADGWIKVPQESDVFSPGGFFVPNGNMINLETRELAAFGSKNMAGVRAGESTTTHGATLAANRHFSLQMKVRQAGDPSTERVAGVCHHVAINNTGYDNVEHHPSWAGFTDPPNSLGVCLLDVQQLIVDGCSGITDALDVLLTTAHPNLGGVSLRMRGPGGPYTFNLPAAVPGERFGTATPNGWSITDLEPCAYLIELSAAILLTDGDQAAGSLEDEIPICKTSKKTMRIG